MTSIDDQPSVLANPESIENPPPLYQISQQEYSQGPVGGSHRDRWSPEQECLLLELYGQAVVDGLLSVDNERVKRKVYKSIAEDLRTAFVGVRFADQKVKRRILAFQGLYTTYLELMEETGTSYNHKTGQVQASDSQWDLSTKRHGKSATTLRKNGIHHIELLGAAFPKTQHGAATAVKAGDDLATSQMTNREGWREAPASPSTQRLLERGLLVPQASTLESRSPTSALSYLARKRKAPANSELTQLLRLQELISAEQNEPGKAVESVQELMMDSASVDEILTFIEHLEGSEARPRMYNALSTRLKKAYFWRVVQSWTVNNESVEQC